MEFGQAIQEVFKSQVDAAKAGGTQAVSGEVADVIVDTFYDMFGDQVPGIAKLAWVRVKMAPLLLTALLMLACKIWPDKVPKATLMGKLSHAAAIAKWQETAKPLVKYVRLYVAEITKRLKTEGILEQLKASGMETEIDEA